MERRIRVQIAYNRVRGARSRTARREEKRSEEEGRGGRTWRVLVAGDRPGEDLAKGGASRPAVAARKQGPRSGGEVNGGRSVH